MFFILFFACQQSELIPLEAIKKQTIDRPIPMEKSSVITKANRWNVVVVTADTLRGDMLSGFGNSQVQTPNLDKVAERGVRFLRAYTNITTTVPAHASLFSSLYPMDHGAYHNRSFVNEKIQMLPEILHASGWFTGAIVNMPWLNPSISNITQGIQFLKSGNLERSADETTSIATSFLNSHADDERPFFLWVHYIDNHTPYKAPYEFSDMYYSPEKNLKSAENKSLQHTWSAFPKGHQDNIHVENWLSGITDIEYVVAQYKGSVSWLDQQLYSLFDTMEQNDLWSNTIFIFTSDHGESLGEHNLWFCHGGLFEPTVRIPLIFYYPDGPSNLTITDPVAIVDIMPTILSLLGLPIGQNIRGYDLIPVMQGGHSLRSEVLLEHTGQHLMGMVTRHYKYIEHRKNQDEYPLYPITKGTIELYDLSTDPGEENNLAQELPDLAKQLKRRMNQYLSFRGSHPPQIEGFIDPKTEERLKALGYTE